MIRYALYFSPAPVSGRLFYFVGPSGAGKDTLLQWVKERVSDDIVFARRTITRPPHPSEAHEPMEEAAFVQLAAAGEFAMTWQANGLHYGIRRAIEAELKAGRDVIVNGSREYVPRLQQTLPDAQIIWIEADPALVRRRIESRQRETGAALLMRIDRAAQFAPQRAPTVIRLDNNGPIQQAGQRVLDILSRDERIA